MSEKNLPAQYELHPSDDNPEIALLARTEQLSMLTRHLILVAEEEKAELARELHSEFGACCTVIAMDLSVAVSQLGGAEPLLAGRLQRVMATLEKMINLKRHIVEKLRPSMLDSLGLSFSLLEHIDEFSRINDLAVDSDICDDFDHIGGPYAIALFRIMQESMSNIIQHASAGKISITLRPDDTGLSLCIVDDGNGIAKDAMNRPGSRGLAIMRERATMLGGTLNVQPGVNGRGTEIEVHIPLSAIPERPQ